MDGDTRHDLDVRTLSTLSTDAMTTTNHLLNVFWHPESGQRGVWTTPRNWHRRYPKLKDRDDDRLQATCSTWVPRDSVTPIA